MLDVRQGVLIIDAGSTSRYFNLDDALRYLERINFWVNVNSTMNKVVIVDFTSVDIAVGDEGLNLMFTRGKTLSTQKKGGKILFVVTPNQKSMRIKFKGRATTYSTVELALKKATMK